jgi:hypothetical protein
LGHPQTLSEVLPEISETPQSQELEEISQQIFSEYFYKEKQEQSPNGKGSEAIPGLFHSGSI